MWSGAAQGLPSLRLMTPARSMARNSRSAAARFFLNSGRARERDGLASPVLRSQLAIAAGADLGDLRKLPQQLPHLLVSLDLVDAAWSCW